MSASPLSAANTYALLTELQCASIFGNQGSCEESEALKQLESTGRPFDQVYCVKLQQHVKESGYDGLGLIAKQLSLATIDGVCQVLERCREVSPHDDVGGQAPLHLHTFACASVAGPRQKHVERLAKRLARVIGQQWLINIGPNEWERISHAIHEEEVRLRQEALDTAEDSDSEDTSSSIRIDEWRHALGVHASTRFAYAAISRVCDQALHNNDDRPKMLSLRHPESFIENSAKFLSVISASTVEPQTQTDVLANEDEAIVNRLAANGNRILAKLIDTIDQMTPGSAFEGAQVNQILMTECTNIIEECYRAAEISEYDLKHAWQADAQETLGNAHVDLLQCGYERRTVIIVPSTGESGEAIEMLKSARPVATVLPADIDESFVFCEGTGIKASSLVRGFERVYPGIAEAARRLLTRIDINNWLEGSLESR